MAYFIHPQALVETTAIGNGTRIWAFAHVAKDVVIGDDCNIGDHCFLESGVLLGSRITLKNGVSLWTGVVIEDDVFVGPNATFVNDQYPRSKVYRPEVAKTILRRGASIGANATLLGGITVGQFGMIGAGSVVTRDVADFQLVLGNPARPVGWVDRSGEKLHFDRVTQISRSGATYELENGIVRMVEG